MRHSRRRRRQSTFRERPTCSTRTSSAPRTPYPKYRGARPSLSTLAPTCTRPSQLAQSPPAHSFHRAYPNSEMLGGTNVPAATAPTVTVACTSAPASRETDALPDIWGTVFVGHWMFVLNRLVVPEKSTGVVFCESVSLKLFAFLRAASCT